MINTLHREILYKDDHIPILILSESLAKEFTSEEKWWCISIVDPSCYHPKICCSCKNVLQLHFEDTESAADRHAFTSDNAQQILDFVEAFSASDATLLVIHCYAGISRSAGVGKAISKLYNESSYAFDIHYDPNSLVYDILLREDLRRNHPRV